MYFLPFKCLENKKHNCFFFPIDYDIEILNICFKYGYFSDSNVGYAHLLEHMVIKNCQKSLEYIYKSGVQYNAVTKEYVTVYTFINLRNENIILENQRNIINVFKDLKMENINNSMFMQEKATILEELSLLERQFTAKSAHEMLGDKKRIEEFSFDKMKEVCNLYYNNPMIIYIGKQNNINEDVCPITSTKRWNFKKNIVLKREKNNFVLKNCYEANVILYFLHICYISQISKDWEMQISIKTGTINIQFIGNVSILHKNHILHRYELLCLNIKFLMEEIEYLVINKLLDLDVEENFFDNWEGVFNE